MVDYSVSILTRTSSGKEIMPLGKEDQILVLKEVKEILSSIEKYDIMMSDYRLSEYLVAVIELKYVDIAFDDIDDIKYYIPLFTYENAVKHSNANMDMGLWWNSRDKLNRIKFLNWMLEQLQK